MLFSCLRWQDVIARSMSKVIDYQGEVFKRSTKKLNRVAETVLEDWIGHRAEPARVVDVVGSAMAVHVARGRGHKGDLRQVSAGEESALADLASDVDWLLNQIRRGGVKRKRVLECLGLIRMCARATDLEYHHGLQRHEAVELAGKEARAIVEFFENDINEPFFPSMAPCIQS